MFNITAIIGIACAVCLGSGSLILPEDEFITGWKRDGKTLTFRANDLYGHINGGAEIFLEFGFQDLCVQNYINGDAEITIEIYHMSDSEAALGIYLMKMGKESAANTIKARNSTNRYQSIAARGDYYIQINNFSGREDLLPAVTGMANFILEQIPDRPLAVFAMLPADRLITGSERIIRGSYALQPIYTFGAGDILLLNRSKLAVYAEYRNTDNSAYGRLRVEYAGMSAANDAFLHLKNNLDVYLQILEEKKSGFIFRDYNNKYGRVTLAERVMDIIIKSEKPPE